MRQVYQGQPFSGEIFVPFLDDPSDLNILIQYQMLYRCRILLPQRFVEQTGGVFPASTISAQLQERMKAALEQRFANGITEEEATRPPVELIDTVLESFNQELKASIGMDVVQLRFNEFGMSDEDRSYIDMGRRLAKEGAPPLGSPLMWEDSQPEPAPEAPLPVDTPAAEAAPEPEPASEPTSELEPTVAAEHQTNRWICPCGRENDRKFCPACGTPRSFDHWICGDCGTENQGKFCYFCGRPAMEEA